MRLAGTWSQSRGENPSMQQLIFGVIIALVVLAMFGLPVVSDQAPPPHAGTIIIGAG